jgi:hypothetical protein
MKNFEGKAHCGTGLFIPKAVMSQDGLRSRLLYNLHLVAASYDVVSRSLQDIVLIRIFALVHGNAFDTTR